MTTDNQQDGPPLGLRLHDQLGPLPEDALRRQAFVILSRLRSGTEDVVRLDTALAAVAAERERRAMATTRNRCAHILERIANEPPVNGNELAQARVLMAIAQLRGA